MKLLNHVLFPLICCLLSGGALGAEILDKVVAVVGKNVITASEVAQQLRLESFINQRPVDNSSAARSLALRRLIDQSLISQEMLITSFLGVSDEQIKQELAASRQQEFPNGMSFDAALKAYNLSEEDLRDFLRRQLNMLRFIDFRFRTGMEISEDEIKSYYENSYTPQVRLVEAGVPEPLTEVHGQIRQIVAQQQVDALLDDWLKRVRATSRIDIADSGEFVEGRQVE